MDNCIKKQKNDELIHNEYLDRASAAIYIGISEDLLSILAEKKDISLDEYSITNNCKNETDLYSKVDLDDFIIRRKEFFDNYYNEDEYNEIISKKSKLRTLIAKYDIPLFAFDDKYSKSKFCIKKSECQSVLDMRSLFFENHYSMAEAREVLPRYIFSLLDEIEIPIYVKYGPKIKFCSGSKICYNKNQVDDYALKRKNFMQNHYSFEEAIKFVDSYKLTREGKKIDIPPYAAGGKFGKINKFCYDKKQVNELKITPFNRNATYDTEKDGTVNKSTAMKYLMINRALLEECVKQGILSPIQGVSHCHHATFFNEQELDDLINLRNEFDQNHFTYKEANNYISDLALSTLTKVEIPIYARGGKFSKKSFAIAKSEVYNLQGGDYRFNSIRDKNPDSLYTKAEVMKILNFNLSLFNKFFTEEHITILQKGSKNYYKKSEVDLLKCKQIGLFELYKENYITFQEGCKLYSKKQIQKLPLTKKEYVPKLLIPYYPDTRFLYRITDIEGEINYTYKNIEALNRIIQFETVSELLDKKIILYNEIYDNIICKFEEVCPFTYTKWMYFITRRLNKSKASNSSVIIDVNAYLYCSSSLFNLILSNGVKEVYELSTKNITDYFDKLPQRHIFIIFRFLKYIFKEIQKHMHKNNINGKKLYNCFIINEHIKTKFKRPKELISADIYTVEEFVSCIEYCSNLDLHINLSLTEIKEKNTIRYVSIWLYILIHLNNGWRSGDARDLKRPFINDYLDAFGIDNPDWFIKNKLSLPDARLILSRIENKEIIINKTKTQGYFFCSDDLAIPVATAICIIETFATDIITDSDTDFLKFYTKYNDPAPEQINRFFKHIKLVDFRFLSKKMNCTLLSFIYSLTLEDDKDKALLYAQRLRGHIWNQSTLHYINIDKKDIQFLCCQLFERGEFGYVYDLLISKMFHKNELVTFEEKTEKIKEIKQSLSTYFHVELICNFLNRDLKEKADVFKSISKMSYDEIENTLEKIYAGCLPSKEANIQCFISASNCTKYGDKAKCKNCANAIPNLYALNKICKSATKNLVNYNNEDTIGEKIKLSIKIDNDLELISEAVSKYGKELVYSFMNIKRGDYLKEVMDNVEPAENLYLLSDYLE